MVSGAGGRRHGSRPHYDNSAVHLVNALSRLAAWERPVTITPETRVWLDRLAAEGRIASVTDECEATIDAMIQRGDAHCAILVGCAASAASSAGSPCTARLEVADELGIFRQGGSATGGNRRRRHRSRIETPHYRRGLRGGSLLLVSPPPYSGSSPVRLLLIRVGRVVSTAGRLAVYTTGCAVALVLGALGLVVVVLVVLFVAEAAWPACFANYPEDNEWYFSPNQSGHYGPAWGRDDDGGVIVFRWGEGRDPYGGTLYTIREDGTDLKRLSPTVGDLRKLKLHGEDQDDRVAFDTSPTVSPDGTRLAYATLRHGDYPGDFDIVTSALDGGERRMIEVADMSGAERVWATDTEPAWSPDGTRIAFLRRGRLHTMAADGSDVRSLAPSIWAERRPPAWSPDGTRLAVLGYGAGTESETPTLYLVDADGSNLRAVAGGPYYRPMWSPDGRYLAVRIRDSFKRRFNLLALLDVEDETVEVLLDLWELGSEGQFVPFVWSPDGAEIIFVSYGLNQSSGKSLAREAGVYAIAVDGEREIRWLDRPELLAQGERELGNAFSELAWSPDGASLAVSLSFSFGDEFADWLSSNPYANVVLYTVAADGSDLRILLRVNSDGRLVAEEDWSP